MTSSVLLGSIVAAIGFFTLFRIFKFQQDNTDSKSYASLSLLPAPSSLSPSSVLRSLSQNWTHQVFPSFRGEDVRRDILSHIQKESQRKGITPFIDNVIRRGENPSVLNSLVRLEHLRSRLSCSQLTILLQSGILMSWWRS